ncbi:Autotransporter adhesin [hydrothermal vent metagenome]|uniref:Autotransporter adhesin n=1 Tax=hydrothermal vent metagenome TaxID=652676 RepID=A0A1W1CWQ1_9ZZZZ
MKNIILLSVVATSFVLGANVVNDLEIDQINKVHSNSSFSNGATVSQGQTDIQNNSNVNDVSILQRDGANAGNLIENTTISGTNSELHQGLTSIDNSRLDYADLESDNTVRRVEVTSGKSTITQGNLIIGGDSNISGSAGSTGGGFGGIGGSTGENLEITQINLLEDTSIKNSNIHQGHTVINSGAEVSKTFKLNQNNSITLLDATGNDINASTLTQGITNISGGITSDIEQNIRNIMEDITVDGSTIKQSSINFSNSTVSNINNNNNEGNPDDRNRVTKTEALNDSTIKQSSINLDESTIDGLYKQETDGLNENNWIHTVTVDDSTVKQSTLNAINDSHVTNVTYKKESMSEIYSAPNLVYNSDALNNSNFLQDVSELNYGDIEDTTFNRGNSINTVNADNSTVKQFNITVNNSALRSSNLRASSITGGVNLTNANLSQGSTIITN